MLSIQGMRNAMQRHAIGSGRTGEEGNAYAEAVIMLPIFVLVWACIVFVFNGFTGAIDSVATSRQEAWRHSLSSCDGRPRSRVRAREIHGRGPLGAVAAVLRVITRILSFLPFMRRYLPPGDVAAGLELVEHEYTLTGRVRKPRPLGRGRATFGHSLALVCNETPRDINLVELAAYAYVFIGL